MDDFYDTDIGVQTSDILILPSSFLGTLWSELQKVGNEECRRIMFTCGHSVGKSLSVNYTGMSTDDLDMILNQAWAEAGLGHLFVLDSSTEKIVVKLENLLEVSIIGAGNHCDFTAGCLSGVLEGLLQQPYSVVEEMVGEETRLFKFDKK
jgi:predicted hydrocarbon binding protein